MEGIKATSAVRMVRMPQDGCQVSWWCAVTERQMRVPVSKRPFGVRRMISGGRSGYSGGRRMRPWYRPRAKGVSGGPRTVKCHSKRSVSSGAA